MTLQRIYADSLALLTDLYQLTMAYGYWKLGRVNDRAAFHLFFRSHPFGGGYTVAAGLETALEYLARARFSGEDLDYLAGLRGNDGSPLFEPAFIDYLGEMRIDVDVDAMPEGTVAFPYQPLLRVTGSLLQGQILETPLLNILNFQTLIATKASRITQAAPGEPVLEFGLRRAQGVDGALAASRAAFIGGCSGTSNVLAGKLYGIPVRGTHAHSWVMSFDDELKAFDAYAEVMPNNCVLLVDTYDTLEGVRRATETGKRLEARGAKLAGIRLDSGDLAYLSTEARAILDAAGFEHTAIFASNDLDEHIIRSLKDQGARITAWGIGTKLVTAFDQPALAGVYKLTAVANGNGIWQPKVKISEQTAKVSVPGVQQVRRFWRERRAIADMTYDEQLGPGVPQPDAPAEIVHPTDPTQRKRIRSDTHSEDLLVPVLRGGQRVYQPPALADVASRVQDQLAQFHPAVRRTMYPHSYPAGLESQLHELRTELILKGRSTG